MRPPEKHIRIALFGGSAVGKTTCARIIAERLNCKIRECGEVIKERQAHSIEELRVIDAETRRIVSNETAIIVEGRYLDSVLVGVRHVFHVSLECLVLQREVRASAKASSTSIISDRDILDEQLRKELFGQNPIRMAPDLEIDTTEKSPDIVAAMVIRNWNNFVRD